MTSYQKEAPLVLVTGGGSGIGRAFCSNLHKRGYSLLVVSLVQAELDSLKEELVNGPPVETLALDITTDGLFGNHIDWP